MIDVEIIYTNDRRIKVAADQLHSVPHQNVLILAVHTATQSYRIHGDNFFVFGYKDSDEWFCTGWDDFDDKPMRVYSEKEPNGAVFSEKRGTRRTDYYPEDFIMTRFGGGRVSSAAFNRIVSSSSGTLLSRDRLRGDR